ncbi:hypothetical protein OQJ26_14910 [Legionella sp. PATHC038]|uniref:hypothetical protein n=1 Tax=Legionella sheltonii TaxID=2992041 RepID=UPI002244A571|nr:hypothetical protein [Legionella sp. PATHC038]MCW8400072.1 hypothetical protein [Legionella sp. PATHC038]
MQTNFAMPLTHSFSFALKKGASLKAIDGWTDSEYTQKEIEEAINPEVAVFHNGQIFTDLGMLLEQKVKDPEVIALFKNLFKIEPFLELRNQYPEFKPNTLKAVEVIQEAPAKAPELSRFKTTSFFQEEKKEPSLIDGQASRVSCQR